MKKSALWVITIAIAMLQVGCDLADTQDAKDSKAVQRQQEQYSASQPVPAFDWSLERHLIIQLYQARNAKVATHAVWRSDRGMVEGDCASIGFSLPYDTSLTNPLAATDQDPDGYDKAALATIEQAEPNGIFASKNTAATWVMCAGDGGVIEPVYVETKVTVYPYPVAIDYATNRVRKAGASTVKLRADR